MPEVSLPNVLVPLALGLALVLSRLEVLVLRRRQRRLLKREAALEARARVADDTERLHAKYRDQAFREGVLEGLRQADGQVRAQDDRVWRQGYEHGLLEGERKAEEHFRVDYWTEIHKNQGYFFTSAEVIAYTQLMYKNIPIGQPQRHVLEKSESVDRESIERAVSRMLGEKAPVGPETGALDEGTGPRLRVVPREPAKALAGGKG